MNATVLQGSEKTNGEIPSKVAQWAEYIGINLQKDFKRLLWPVNTQILYPRSSDGHFNRKNSYTFWKIFISCQDIIEENADHYQGVIKFQRNGIKGWMSQSKNRNKLQKPMDLDQANTSVTFCNYSDNIGEPH